ELSEQELSIAVRDLGGHDLADLLDAFRRADELRDRPTVIFAYTIKAWSLPTEGHPGNHSALLTEAQWRDLASKLGADPEHPWAHFAEGSPERRVCVEAAERLRREPVLASSRRPFPPIWAARTPARNPPSRASGASSWILPAPLLRPPPTS